MDETETYRPKSFRCHDALFNGLVKLVIHKNQIVLGKQPVFVGGYFVVEGEQVLHQFVIGGQAVAADDEIGG